MKTAGLEPRPLRLVVRFSTTRANATTAATAQPDKQNGSKIVFRFFCFCGFRGLAQKIILLAVKSILR